MHTTQIWTQICKLVWRFYSPNINLCSIYSFFPTALFLAIDLSSTVIYSYFKYFFTLKTVFHYTKQRTLIVKIEHFIVYSHFNHYFFMYILIHYLMKGMMTNAHSFHMLISALNGRIFSNVIWNIGLPGSGWTSESRSLIPASNLKLLYSPSFDLNGARYDRNSTN